VLTGAFQSAIILLTGAVYYGVDFWLIRRYDQLRTEEGSGRSWRYTVVMIVLLVVLAVQPLLLPGLGFRTDEQWGLVVQSAGLVLLVGAFVLHWWARSHLQQFYVEDVVFQAGQYLVDTGPYRYVRHPLFTSFLMIATGLFLVNPALITLLIVIYAFIDFSQAARKEERLLSEKLPDYADYMERTGRFLPRWR
jgi:protein-S-isoprenylcysteine O-methyltransferase Ste14